MFIITLFDVHLLFQHIRVDSAICSPNVKKRRILHPPLPSTPTIVSFGIHIPSLPPQDDINAMTLI